MGDDVQAVFDAVRAACFPATWARGVALARADAVVEQRSGAGEAIFRIVLRGGMLSRRVTLFVEDRDWECECASHETACEHVVAAVVAWQQARRAGVERVAPRRAAARVGYRFTRTPGGLALERVLERDGAVSPLEATLAAVSEGRAAGGRFVATQDDLALELALGTHRRGLLPPQLLSRLFGPLSRCDDVTLDGVPIRAAADPVLPRARLQDSGEDGLLLSVEPDPAVTESFANGAVLCGSTLHRVGDPRLTAVEREQLGRGRRFGPGELAELVTEVLPALRRRIPLVIETSRLPATQPLRPRAMVEVAGEGRTLSVLATIVYGDPPIARVDAGRLALLGAGAVPVRDRRAEEACAHALERDLGLAPGGRVEFSDEEAVAFNARLSRWGGTVRGAGRERFELAPALECVVRAESGFSVSFETPPAGGGRSRGGRADASTVLRAWSAGRSLVPLVGGGWAPLPREWLDRFGQHVADLLAARDAAGTLPRCCLADVARLCEALDQPPPAELGALRRLAAGFEGIPSVAPPADLVTRLRSYQLRGVAWLVFLRDAGLGALLADDMGLGKTVQVLCALRPPALVVAPTSVLHNWAAEIGKHRPALKHCVFHGPRRELEAGADVTLTSYAILRLEAGRLADRAWETIVLDEAQAIKNPDSQVAGAAFRLDGRFRVALSGTPVENRLDELWSQLHFTNRGLLGGRAHFRARYADPIEAGDERAARDLRERIGPFVLRRLKRDVAPELPPRTEMVLRCELEPAEREVYDTVRAATLDEVVRRLDTGAGVLAVLESLLRLRQAACHAGLVPGVRTEGSSKLRVLLEALESVVAEGHKALVFSQWTSLLDLTEPHLAAAGIRATRLDGSTRDRAAVVDRFQHDPAVPVMLVSLRAGGTGLNLTAADHVFLLDPWWNPAVEDQAADRAHRIGQERPVMIYRLVASDTVEERILELQRRKREIAEVAVGGGTAAAALSRADLLRLLGIEPGA